MIPVKKFKFAKSKPESLVGDVVEFMKDRDRALRKATRTKNSIDKAYARRVRNRTNVLIRNAKNSFIKEKLQNYSDNPKKLCEQIKSVIPTAGLNNPIILLDNLGSKLNNQAAANLVNSYFTNIGSVLANQIQNPTQGLPPRPRLHQNLVNSLGLTIPTHAEIKGWMKKLQVFKSSGIPLIATRIWKSLFIHEPNLLYKMIVSIFNTSIFPTTWKSATVVPIPKVAKIKGPEDLYLCYQYLESYLSTLYTRSLISV